MAVDEAPRDQRRYSYLRITGRRIYCDVTLVFDNREYIAQTVQALLPSEKHP